MNMRIVIAILASVFLSQLSFADQPPTMRIDFFHTGNREVEMFSLDQLVLEPLPFPGNLQQAVVYAQIPIAACAVGIAYFGVMVAALLPWARRVLWTRPSVGTWNWATLLAVGMAIADAALGFGGCVLLRGF